MEKRHLGDRAGKPQSGASAYAGEGASAQAAGEETLVGAVGGEGTIDADDMDMTPFLRKIVFFSSGGAFLDGYVLSLIGVALTLMTPSLALTPEWSAAIGASALAGIFFGAILGGYLTDLVGRRLMFIIDVVCIAVLSAAGALAGSALQVFLSRFLLGVFIGVDYPIATSLIAEFAPKRHRAVCMGTVSLAWYVGATVAAFVGYFLYPVDGGWKWMLASAIVPCVILLVGRHDIPESPRWLHRKGYVDEAAAVVERVYGKNVVMRFPDEPAVPMRTVFKGGYGKRVLFLGAFILCQVVPMYAIYTFGPEIMSAFGMESGRDSILGESIVSCFFIAGNIPAMFWLNSAGRRRMTLVGFSGMLVGLLMLAVWPTAPLPYVIAGFAVYAFASGAPGILQWLYPNEMFPTEVRATAVGLAIAFSRIGVVISTYGQPLFMARYGVGATMAVGAGLVALALVWSYFAAPETKGMSLEESSKVDR